jgi:hypothetical protein
MKSRRLIQPLTAVFRNQLVHLIAALAPTLAAFDAQHIELAFDVAEGERVLIRSPRRRGRAVSPEFPDRELSQC